MGKDSLWEIRETISSERLLYLLESASGRLFMFLIHVFVVGGYTRLDSNSRWAFILNSVTVIVCNLVTVQCTCINFSLCKIYIVYIFTLYIEVLDIDTFFIV